MNRNDTKLGIAYQQGPFENIYNAISFLDLTPLTGKSVLIKPNNGRKAKPGQGINTDPQVVAAVIEVLQKAGASRIAIGESPIVGVNTIEAFEENGIAEVARKYGIELINLDEKKPVIKKIKQGRVLNQTRVCAEVFNFDLILSLPVAKTHMHTGVTLGIKNMKGCLHSREKVRYHQVDYQPDNVFPEKSLDSAISDLSTILLPDITVVDGYIGMEGLGPSGGEAICSDFAVASFNPVAADLFACKMMGIEAADVPHLRLTAERNLLSLNPNDYQVFSEGNYLDNVVPYKMPPSKVSIQYPDVIVHDQESCSACLSTLMFFLKRFKDDMTPYICADGKLHLAIGKGIDDSVDKGCILIGNCTKKAKSRGVFVPGCPPVPTKIYEALTGREPDENEPDIK